MPWHTPPHGLLRLLVEGRRMLGVGLCVAASVRGRGWRAQRSSDTSTALVPGSSASNTCGASPA